MPTATKRRKRRRSQSNSAGVTFRHPAACPAFSGKYERWTGTQPTCCKPTWRGWIVDPSQDSVTVRGPTVATLAEARSWREAAWRDLHREESGPVRDPSVEQAYSLLRKMLAQTDGVFRQASGRKRRELAGLLGELYTAEDRFLRILRMTHD